MAFSSVIDKKYMMGGSGLFLVFFLITHLSGNLLLFTDDGGKSFNTYAHFMSTNKLIRILEIGLFLGFIAHIVMGIFLTYQNYKARPIKYKLNKISQNSLWVSRNMGFTGSIIFVFLVIHLKTFFVESRFYAQDDVYQLVRLAFQNPFYVGLYIISLLALGLHLSHGFQSIFQSLGFYHKKYTPLIKKLGYLIAVVIPSGFASIPLFFYLQFFFRSG